MFHPFPHIEIGERFTSYMPQAKERHGKGRQLRGPAGGAIPKKLRRDHCFYERR
jgi:hypothetical protein